MDVHATIIELKPGVLSRVREWAAMLNQRRDEAVATLRDEGVEIESWFLFSRDGSDFLICYMRAESMQKAKESVRESLHEIDAYHQAFKREAWHVTQPTELLLDLVLP